MGFLGDVSLLGRIDRYFFAVLRGFNWNDVTMGIDGDSLDAVDLSLGFSSFFLLRLDLFGVGWGRDVLGLGSIGHGFGLSRWLIDNLSVLLVLLV